MARVRSGGGKLPSTMPSAVHPRYQTAGKGKDVNAHKKKRRWKPGTVALRQIRHFQRTTDLLVKRAPFSRLVRQVLLNKVEFTMFPRGVRMNKIALEALQHSFEAYMVSVLEEANLACIHRKKVTVTPRDVQLARRIRHELA